MSEELLMKEQRIQKLLDLCVNTGALSEESVHTLIESGFLTAPASSMYHGDYEGGLFDHSYHVAVELQGFTDKLGLIWQNPLSPIRVGILHDLCKIDQYTYDYDIGVYVYNTDTLLTEHGIKSVVLAQQLPGVVLNEEEIACIVYHMGAFTDKAQWSNYTNAIHKYPNVLWTHTADMYAAHVMEVRLGD